MSAVPALSGFQVALQQFTDRLTASEAEQIKVTSLDDLKVAIEAVQAEQRKKKALMNMTRLSGYIEAMERFADVLKLFLSASDVAAFTWGPVKLLLLTASSWADSFNELLDAYKQIGANLPIILGYDAMFADNPVMQKALEYIWRDILEFHRCAIRIVTRNGLKQFFKPLWKDFRSKFGHLLADLARHKVTIESHAQQMHIQQYMTDREEIFRCFEEIKRGEDRKKYLLVREWLDATDPEADHENALKVRQDFPKSGMWIFDNKNVRDWRLASPPKSSILWISGKPGAGKSILASVIIEELRKENALPLAFFYCKNADPSRRSYVHVMKGLLAQLIHHERHVVPYYYDKAIASSGQTLASARAIAAYLHDMMRVTENAVIVIDGLDECERDERNDILTSLVDLVHQCDYDRPGKLRLCIVSRNEKDIRDHLRTARHFALSSGDNRDDIKMYVDHWAAKITQLFKLGPSDQSYIVRNVMERTQEMFLFAKLVLLNLYRQPSLQCLHQELHPSCFPKGLDEAYGRTFNTIKQNPCENEARVAHTIVTLLSRAKRPLRWREIQGILSIDTKSETIDEARCLSKQIEDICGSLVEVLPGKRIQFVHATVSYYAVECQYISEFSAECSIAAFCLHYLTFPCFDMNEGGPSKRQMVLENLYRGYHVVQEYVVSYWMAHLETVMRISSRMASDAQKSDAQHEWPEDMTAAIANFAERYHDDLEHTVSGRQAIEESGELDFLRHLGCFEDLVTLVGHIRSVVSVGDRRDQVSLESLGKAVDFSREILESQGESAVATQADRDRLRHWYGAKWYKCSRLTCFYFSEGFESRPAREEHRGRHERPFRCEEQDCTMFYFGFASARELEKHKNEQHPDTTEKSKHKCPICFATFPRAYNLRSHQKVHSKEKPFGCDYCGKPFARTHDRKRHQSTCKYGKNVANCVQ